MGKDKFQYNFLVMPHYNSHVTMLEYLLAVLIKSINAECFFLCHKNINQYPKSDKIHIIRLERECHPPEKLKNEISMIFDSINPDFIITTSDINESYFVNGEAKVRKIPSLCIFSVIPATCKHLILSKITRIWRHIKKNKICHPITIFKLLNYCRQYFNIMYFNKNYCPNLTNNATKTAVWGDAIKKSFIERGSDPEDIVITGCPFHDKLFNLVHNYSNCKVNYKNFKSRKVTLYISEPLYQLGLINYSNMEKIINTLYFEARNHGLFIIKLHPQEKIEDYPFLLDYASSDDFLCISDEHPLDELIYSSDFIVMPPSTVGIDAIVLGKKILILDINKFNIYQGFCPNTSIKNLEINIQNLMCDSINFNEYDKERDRFIKNYAYKFDGKSSERIVSLILNMLNYEKKENYDL